MRFRLEEMMTMEEWGAFLDEVGHHLLVLQDSVLNGEGLHYLTDRERDEDIVAYGPPEAER